MLESPDCVVLCELFSSPRGSVSLGRLLRGGRAALLREVPGTAPADLERAVEEARGVAHPQLLKVLGTATDGTRRFIASEYVPGVSLTELNAAVRRRQCAMDAAAAVRIILTALGRVADTRALLTRRGVAPARLLYGDGVWIAEFGEVMITEAQVLARLGRSTAPVPPLASELEAEEVRMAAVELYQLTSARLMTGDIGAAVRRHLPAALAHVIEPALAWDSSGDLDTLAGFSRALRGLPAALVGSEQTVVEELQRLVPDLLTQRREKLSPPEKVTRDSEGPTRVYSVVDAVRARLEANESEEETASLPGQLPRVRLKPVDATPRAVAVPAITPEEAAAGLSVSPGGDPVARAVGDVGTPTRTGPAPWSPVERFLLVVLLMLLVALLVVALQHPERVAGLFRLGGAR